MAVIQVGFVATRLPNGKFASPKPICKEVPASPAESKDPLDDVAKIFAAKYLESVKSTKGNEHPD